VLLAEESDGRLGYSHPFRAVPDGDDLRLDIRIRDFDPAGLAARQDHVRDRAGGLISAIKPQYINMGPALGAAPGLVAAARRAAEASGVDVVIRPIRGGTGVDPFLAKGVAIGNLGTGYFAPESEKELTTLQTMAAHVRWLLALVQDPPA
jgi:tripeptide aminopeptidase